MFRQGRRLAAVALVVGLAVAAAGCSSTGGKKSEQNSNAGVAGGKANTPQITIAMVTHGAPGDTFWDIIRKGAQAAAGKDNVTFKYSSDPDSGKQANLIQSAIDSKVDGIAVTLPDPPVLEPVVKKAIAAGIPVVAFNAGIGAYQASGVLSYFGSDELLAGKTGGKRASDDGFKKVLCVVQFQGQVQLEARCDGVKSAFTGGGYDKIYVNGSDLPSVRTTISAKIKSGDLQWAIDQQPYLQGYLAIDSLWLYKANGNILGGGQPTLTGPFLVDKTNVDFVGKFAAGGTR